MVRFVEIDRDKVMKRHHVDGFASREWLRAVADFFPAACAQHQAAVEDRLCEGHNPHWAAPAAWRVVDLTALHGAASGSVPNGVVANGREE